MRAPQISKRSAAADDDDVGPGQAGLAEVELPIEAKLRNIEATELAKQALLEKQQAKLNRAMGIKGGGPRGFGGEGEEGGGEGYGPGGGKQGGGKHGKGGAAAPAVPRMPIGPYFGGKELQDQGTLAARLMDK